MLFLVLNVEGDDRFFGTIGKKVMKTRPIAASEPVNAPYSRLLLYKYCVKITSRSPKGGNIKTRKVAIKIIPGKARRLWNGMSHDCLVSLI